MSISHTISVSDLANQDAVHRVLWDVRNHGTSYSLIQDGVEVAKVVPPEEKDDKVSDEVTRQRWEALARMDVLAKRIAEHWTTDETAVEAITNDRNASERRLFHGSR